MFKKILLILLLFILGSPLFANLPNYKGYVNDFTNTLNSQEITYLNQIALQLKEKTGIEFVTVIINSFGNDTIEEYANKLFEKWGIGSKEKNDGLLFITALQERKTRIEVGYGLEGILTDGQAGSILNKFIIPYFKVGNYKKGIIVGNIAIAQYVAKANGVELSNTPQLVPQNSEELQIPGYLKVIFVLIFALLIFISIITGNWWFIPLLFFSSSFDSRNNFSGFGGSGFGGFGGGLSGGGGASGSW